MSKILFHRNSAEVKPNSVFGCVGAFISSLDTFPHSASPPALTFYRPSPFISLCLPLRAASLSGRVVSRSSRSISSCASVELLHIHKVTDSSGL